MNTFKCTSCQKLSFSSSEKSDKPCIHCGGSVEFVKDGIQVNTQSLNEFAADIHQNAVDHGWWEKERSFPEIIALIHSELSEALEEFRSGKPLFYYNIDECDGLPCSPILEGKHICENVNCTRGRKPEGVAVELADCIIRILDYCGKEGIDIETAIRIKHEYNKSRPYRHGGKKC